MAAAVVHPTDQALESYGLGKLDDATAGSVSKHLESCSVCQRRVAELSSDEFLERLRNAKGKPELSATVGSEAAGSRADPGASAASSAPPAETIPRGLAEHRDYQVLRELGRGGMGVVYLAHNRLMGRDEVLKVVGGHLVDRPGVRDRFLREIQSAAKLQHKNIVTAYAAMRFGESIALSMEYVPGHDLAQLVKSGGPLPVAHACSFIHQAAVGLQHAHERGMVHRDIKPANLILAREGKRAVVKVADFGLAKVTSEGQGDGGLTREGQMLGTPDYIAPEQIRDAQSADIRADIYSLGCTFYYLLSGRPPFRGDHLWDLYQAHFSTVADPLNLVRPEVPVELAALVAKMMAKDPKRRFQTPGELAQALAPFFRKGSEATREPNLEVSRAGQLEAGHGTTRAAPAPTLRPIETTPERVSGTTKPAPTQPGSIWEGLIDLGETEPLSERISGAPVPATAPEASRGSLRAWSSAVRILSRPGPRAWWAAAGVVLLALAAAWAATIFRLKPPGGTIVLENVPAHELSTESGAAPNDGPPKRSTDDQRPDPITDRSQFSIRKGDWRVEGDQLVQSNESEMRSALMFGDERWTDYDITVDAMRTGGTNSFSVYFRSTSGGTEVEYEISGQNNEICRARAYERGQERTLQSDVYFLVDLRWYTARVEVRGKHCAFFIEGLAASRREIRLFDVELSDDHHTMGRVGLGTALSAYRFKNLRVTAPDGRVLWEGLPAVESSKPADSPKPALPPATLAETQKGFVQIFNGIDLKGWKTHDQQPGNWHVENGNLVGSGPAAVSHLYTIRDDYKDFHLRLEARINPGGNSGVYFRAPFGPRRPLSRPQWPLGFEVQIDCSNPDQAKTGSLSGSNGILVEVQESPVPARRWFSLDVIAEGNHVVVKVDGRTTADYIDDRRLLASGHIALQQWKPETVVEFRKIEVREIPSLPVPIASQATAAPSDGFAPLFNGKNLSGWIVERGDPAIWSVQEGAIVARSHSDWRKMSFLVTDRDFSDFVVRFQFKLPKNADGGFVFRTLPGDANTPIDLNIRSFNETPSLMAALFWSKSDRAQDSLLPRRPPRLRPEGTWNDMEAEVRGDTLHARVNGLEVLVANLDAMSGLANAKPGLARRSGRIGFQAHTSTVYYRNIEIKDLSRMNAGSTAPRNRSRPP
jgi:serine/threonine protein kinase